MKDTRDEICKEMPQKTDINNPYIDNTDAYNRDRQLITASQVRVAVKHTDRTSEFPEHLS